MTSPAEQPLQSLNTAPVFVLSCARSGSTLTRLILDTHPEIYSPAELDMGATARRLYTMIARLEVRDNVPYEANPQILAQVRQILGGLMDDHARRRGKRIWCEKSPDNLGHQDFLARAFPEARFVCLYRHCRDVVRSCLEVSRHGFIPVLHDYVRQTPDDTVQATVRYWTDSTAGMLDFERRWPGRSFRLIYENLVTHPEETLRPLFEFLGVAWDPTLIERIFSATHDRGEGDSLVLYSGRINRDSIGSGRVIPLETLPVELGARMEAFLRELGYEGKDLAPATPEAPATPATPAITVVAKAGGGASQGEDARWVFETVLPKRLDSLEEPPFDALSCCFAVRGAGGGDWVIEMDEDGFQVIPDSRQSPVTIEIDTADLLDLVHGRQNALRLVMEGKARVTGDIDDTHLQKLVTLLRVDL